MRNTRIALTLAAAFVSLASSIALAQPMPIMAGKLEAGDRVAICGDSITEQKNYSAIIEGYLLVTQSAKLNIAQFGWGGEATWGFKERLAQDVLWFKPTVATICYGMNDGGYQPVDPKRLADYRESTIDIIKQMKAAGVRHIVIAGPGPVDSDAFRGGGDTAVMYNKTLATFNKAAGEVAKEQGVSFADLHTTMTDAMVKYKAKYPGKSIAGGDGIHPDNLGHTVMAYAILKALGVDGHIGTITVDLAGNSAEGTDGQKILSATGGVVEIESTRYPYPLLRSKDTKDAGSMGIALDILPFNDDLNRYMLVVKGAESAKTYSVTWGKSTMDFTGEELAKGINLADKFNTSPFSDAFGKVDRAVHGQQDFETPMMKQMIHGQKELIKDAPEDAETWKQLAESSQKLDEALRKRTMAMATPVKHTVTIKAK